jgi:hypothetical protein
MVASGLWLLGDGIEWNQTTAAERRQITALDECGRIYPPMPDGYFLGIVNCAMPPACAVTDIEAASQGSAASALAILQGGADTWSKWEDDEAKLHPQCAPRVGSMSLYDFIGLHAADRVELREGFADALRASTNSAITYGVAVPASFLMIGLVLGWVIRGFRKS